jgi:hypothetical protein
LVDVRRLKPTACGNHGQHGFQATTLTNSDSDQSVPPRGTTIGGWFRLNRRQRIVVQYHVFWHKLRDHFAYYGVIGNLPALRLWRKWLSRRHRSEPMRVAEAKPGSK